jgi:hypothetical protein
MHMPATALFALLLAQTPPSFEPVQPDLFAAGGTLTNAWADHDGDGDLDLFVGFNGAPNRLYRNDGGVFTDVATAAGLTVARPTRAAAWGDYDGDGDPDLLVGFTPGEGGVLRLYRNDRGRFRDVTRAAGLRADSGAVRQSAWADFDGDGDLDLFVAFRDRPNALFENVDGEFTDVATRTGLADPRRTVGAVWFDFDADGDLDLYAGNMDGDANALFRNDGGTFTDVAAALGVQWGGRTPAEAANGTVRPCVADVDNDGDFDLFTANYGANGLFINRDDRFVDASAEWEVAIDSRYDSCAFADHDNDGMVDVFVNGTVTGGVAYPDRLFRNRGGAFSEVTPQILVRLDGDHGVQWADFDADGDVDLALTAAPADGRHSLLRNSLLAERAAQGISIMVRDDAGRMIGPGSEIRVISSATGALLGTRLVDSGSGYNSQSAAPVHFGLGTNERIDIEVTVLRDGRRVVSLLERVAVRDVEGRLLRLRIREGRLETGSGSGSGSSATGG